LRLSSHQGNVLTRPGREVLRGIPKWVFLAFLVPGVFVLSSCEESIPSEIETHFCHGARGMCSEILIGHIESATSTLECAVYTFTLEPVAEALADAASRGVSVWVVVEKDQEAPKVTSILQQDGVFVRKDGNADLMHHKFMVIDGNHVVTGSYNWTYSADNKHDENLQVIHSSGVAGLYQEEFQRLWGEGN